MGPHQRLLLQSHLRHLDSLSEEIEELSQEAAQPVDPFEEAVEQLDVTPGSGRSVAEEVLAAIGGDMGQFPTAAHLASWTRVFPGKMRVGQTQKRGHR